MRSADCSRRDAQANATNDASRPATEGQAQGAARRRAMTERQRDPVGDPAGRPHRPVTEVAMRFPALPAGGMSGLPAAPRATLRRVKSRTEYLVMNVPSRRGFVNITPEIDRVVRESGVQE